MEKMVALRSLYCLVRSVSGNPRLLCNTPRQHYYYTTGAAARTTLLNITAPMAKHLTSDVYGSSLSRGLGSSRFFHWESFNSATIEFLYDQIEEKVPDKLESLAVEMYDFLKNEGFAEEANRLLKPFIDKKSAKLPAVVVYTLMLDTGKYVSRNDIKSYLQRASDTTDPKLLDGITITWV